VYHNVALKSKKLAQIVKQCRDIPGKELFQYYDAGGTRKSIDSGQVNNYIKEISGARFTAKDFRTWTGTLYALQAFVTLGTANTITETKKNIVAALDMVAKQLGNTRTVCKKYYVHPALLDMYSDQTLAKYIKGKTPPGDRNYSNIEKLLLRILKSKDIGIVMR
jgi:DNA topoisomerase-1